MRNGNFDYDYELGDEVFTLNVQWDQTGHRAKAVMWPVEDSHPAEYDEVELSIECNGVEFMPDKEAYTAITELAYSYLDQQYEMESGMNDDAAYEARQQRIIDDE